eukprot:1981004-Pyramimonas_sp.AAC.1
MQRHAHREHLADGGREVRGQSHRAAPTTPPRREPLWGRGFASSFRSARYGPRPARVDPRLGRH